MKVIFDKLKLMQKQGTIADITKRNFSKTWNNKFDYLYVRKGNQLNVFNPQFICIHCNGYYADNPAVRSKYQNTLAEPRDILRDGIQLSGLKAHEKSKCHRIAVGKGAKDADYNIIGIVYMEAYLGIPFLTHPFMIDFVRRTGGVLPILYLHHYQLLLFLPDALLLLLLHHYQLLRRSQ